LGELVVHSSQVELNLVCHRNFTTSN